MKKWKKWQYGKLAKWQIGKMAKWQNDKMAKKQKGKKMVWEEVSDDPRWFEKI